MNGRAALRRADFLRGGGMACVDASVGSRRCGGVVRGCFFFALVGGVVRNIHLGLN